MSGAADTTSGRTYAGRTAQERSAQRRAALLDAGLELFGTRAYDDVSVADVIAHAGCTRRAFYEQFADREALLRAVDDHVVAGELTTLLDAAGPPPATWPAIERAVTALTAFYAEDPRRAHVQYVAVVGVSAAMEEHRRHAFRAIADQLGAWLGPRAGATPVARRRAALAVSGAVSELMMDWLWDPDGALEDVTAEVLMLVRARMFAGG